MSSSPQAGWTEFRSQRTHRGAPDASFAARYRAAGPPFEAAAGTLEHWLTERYCFFTVKARGQACRCDVRHPRWSLQPGECQLEENDMVRLLELPALGPPTLCHTAAPLTVQATGLRVAP